MSTRIKSHVGEKTCEGCGKVVEVDLAAQPGTPEFEAVSEVLNSWYKVGRRLFLKDRGQVLETQAEACCLSCVPAAAVKLAMPPMEEDSIDLNSLQVSREGMN